MDYDQERQPLLQGKKFSDGVADYTQQESRTNDPDSPFAGEPTTWECFKVLVGFWVGTFLSALDATLVATLTAAISNSFDSLTLLSWVASGYLIACAAIQPLSGKLTDIYGRRAGFVLAITFFSAGNIICAAAQTEGVMIVGRLVAGAGGGCLNTISTFVASDIIPLRRRGLWQGISNINYGIGLSLGGVVGGWINDLVGWRWAFAVQVPLSVMCAIQVWFTVNIPVKDTGGSKLKRVDFLGSFVLVIAVVLLLTGLNSGGNTVPWSHPLVLTSLPLSLVFLLAFIYIEARVATEPIIPMRQLFDRTVLAACFANWFGSMAFHGLFFYAPIYFQLRGDSTSAAGSKLVPFSVGIGLGSLTAGFIMKKSGRYYWLNAAMMVILVASYAGVSSVRLDSAIWPIMICFFLTGFAYASMLTTTLTAFVAAVEHEYQAVITSASYAFRSVGSTIGITISSAVFQNVLVTELWKQLGHRKHAAEMIPKVRDRLDYVKQLKPSWREPVLEIYIQALNNVFLVLLGLACLTALVSLFMREHVLHTNLARRSSRA